MPVSPNPTVEIQKSLLHNQFRSVLPSRLQAVQGMLAAAKTMAAAPIPTPAGPVTVPALIPLIAALEAFVTADVALLKELDTMVDMF
jgi:hypothetical protein